MKRLLTYLTLLLAITTVYGQCDLPSTKGNDFWVSYFPNAYYTTTHTYNAADMVLIVTGSQSATVGVENFLTGWSITVQHTGGQDTYIRLPNNWQTTSAAPNSMGYHVTSTSPVYLYAHNYFSYSWDATNVLPTSALGTQYLVQDYSEPSIPTSPAVTMVATQDYTTVSMVLPCTIQGSPLAVGDTFTTALQKGQSLMLLSTTNTSFNGMPVTSDKPIALFQGHSATKIGTGGPWDVLLEQARPLEYWGTEFIAMTTLGRPESDYVRITSSDDNCVVRVNGNIVASLNRGMSHTFELPSMSPVAHITTSEPSYACLYLWSCDVDDSLGDPSSVSLNPVNRWICESAFSSHNGDTSAPCNTIQNHHYLNIVTKSTATDSMLLDGLPITGFMPIGNEYSYALLTVPAGAHTLRNSQGTFTAQAYGLSTYSSYAFDVGFNPSPQTYDTIDIYDTACQGYPYDTLGFHLTPGQTSIPGVSLFSFTSTLNGEQTIFMLHLTVLPTAHGSVSDTIMPGDTPLWHGMTLTLPGSYNDTLTAANGCDSVLTLNLEHYGNIFHYYDTVCPGQAFSGYGFNVAAEALVATSYPANFTFQRNEVADSIPNLYILHLTVLPISSTTIRATIIEGDTLHFADTVLTTEGEHHFHYTAANGCDSMVTLHLNYERIGIDADRTGTCPGEPVVLTATGTHIFIWHSSPPSAELDSMQGQNPITVHPSVPTVYILVDSTGQEVASVSVGTAPPPKLCVECDHSDLDFDNPIITFHDCSYGRNSTTWTFDDGFTMSGERATMQWQQPLPDSISVTMTSCNLYNCCADTSFNLPVRIRSVWFPNIFTPNIDGENSIFRCYTSHDVAEFTMTLFNRWGLELWSSKDINQGWDGRLKDGTPCPQGAYAYHFHLRSVNGDVENGIGTVTLIR